jgi:hypothetical protein
MAPFLYVTVRKREKSNKITAHGSKILIDERILPYMFVLRLLTSDVICTLIVSTALRIQNTC